MSKNYILISLFTFLVLIIQANSQTRRIVNVGTHGSTTFNTDPTCNYYYLVSYTSSSKADYTIYSQVRLLNFGFLFSQYAYDEYNMPDHSFLPASAYESYQGSEFVYTVSIAETSGYSTSQIYLYFQTETYAAVPITVEVSAGLSVLFIILIIVGALILVYIGAVVIAVCLGKSITEGLCICLICLGCLACLSRH